MGNLSDKDVLEMLSSFPKHELSTEQRTNTLKAIGEYRPQKRKIYFQRIAGLVAVFLLAIVGSIFYITNDQQEKVPSQHGAIEKETYQSGVFFALMDENDKPVFEGENYGIPNKVSMVIPEKGIVMYDDEIMTESVKVYLWGKGYHPNQILNIEATHLATGIKKHLDNYPIQTGEYGADASASTYLRTLDQPGTWNLEFSLANGKKIGAFTIHVKKPYVLIGAHATLLISQEDFHPGFYKDAEIEVDQFSVPGELELELFSLEDGKSSVFTFTKQKEYTKTDGRRIEVFKGDFQINNTGKYRFTVMQQSQLVHVLPNNQ